MIRGILAGKLLLFAVMLMSSCRQPQPIVINTPVPTAIPPPTATAAPIQVYVTGAVAAPDVYTLPPDSRVKQAVEAAGGFTTEADQVAINLAQPLFDGMQVHVFAIGDHTGNPTTVLSTPKTPANGEAAAPPGGRVNINTANLAELDTLPGIGPVTAQKIINFREANGPFGDIERIKAIEGIGDGKFNQLRDLITVGN